MLNPLLFVMIRILNWLIITIVARNTTHVNIKSVSLQRPLNGLSGVSAMRVGAEGPKTNFVSHALNVAKTEIPKIWSTTVLGSLVITVRATLIMDFTMSLQTKPSILYLIPVDLMEMMTQSNLTVIQHSGQLPLTTMTRMSRILIPKGEFLNFSS